MSNLYEYAIILDPDEEADEPGKAELLVPPTPVLADSLEVARLAAARAIPDGHDDHLGRVRVLLRAFQDASWTLGLKATTQSLGTWTGTSTAPLTGTLQIGGR